MLKVSSYNIDRIKLQSDLKKYETNEYLLRDGIEWTSYEYGYSKQFSYIKNKFFFGENYNKAQLLNTGSNLFSTISDIYATYVATPVWELYYDLWKFVKDYVSLWFATITLERIDGELQMVYAPAKWYFREDGIDRIARFYQNDDAENVDNYYILLQSFYPGYITNELYRASSLDMLEFTNQVPLETIPETSNLEPRSNTWLQVPSLFIVKEDLREQMPVSIYQKIQNTVLAIDRNVVMTTTQFLQNVESYTVFKNINFPTNLLEDYNEGKSVNMSKLGRYLMWNDDSSIEFVNNQNTLIETAIDYETTMIRRLSGTTAIPQEFLWLEQRNSAIGQGSRLLMHGMFIKRIESIRCIFDQTLRKIEDIIMWEDPDIMTYYREDVLAKSDMELLEEIKLKSEIGLLSKQKAIMQLEGLDQDMAIDALQEIKDETEDDTILQSNPVKDGIQRQEEEREEEE